MPPPRSSLGFALALCFFAPLLAAIPEDPTTPAPRRLADTGLYADFATGKIAPSARLFSPQYPLWSDGALKRRWIALPAGTTIDASQPENWSFPAGTRFWKEFSFAGRKIETRMIEKTKSGKWRFAAYVWSEDQREAVLAPEAGLRNHAPIAENIRHDIPSVADCRICHEGAGRDSVLGFTALQLSPDRDPGAPHAEPAVAGSLDLNTLLGEKRLAHAPLSWREHPPVIAATSPRARAALGYLHANCAGCHNDRDQLASVGLSLRAGFTAADLAAAFATSVDQRSKFQMPDQPPGESYRIRSGSPDVSSVVFRMASRFAIRQMPPLGTKIVDRAALDLITAWIREDLSPPTTGNPQLKSIQNP